ncbi:acylphosphatase-1-like [Symsagittifera roscoffensis]|uniref:acylphosphatase-1-like n=1 Tax=Symsagittifera roscoffensis TaxID=84072 RepID=UPI00307B367C
MEKLHFEVFGKVQGVFFRKHTQAEAQKLHLVGWVKNTTHKTVVGIAEGDKPHISEFQHWLKTKGSPKSTIRKAEFKLETIHHKSFSSFEIHK